MNTKEQEVYRVAQELYNQSPDWVTFFREVLGMEGVVRKVYRVPEEVAAFEQTEVYQRIQGMLKKLREKGDGAPPPQEPSTVITVRLPKALHDALKVEAHDRRTSMNKLCIAKLLQVLEQQQAEEQEAEEAAAELARAASAAAIETE